MLIATPENCPHAFVSHDITIHEYYCSKCSKVISQCFNPKNMSNNGQHRPFLVTAKIMDANRLMGLVIEDADTDKTRMNTTQVLTKMLNGYDFNIQTEQGGPIARLTVSDKLTKDGCVYFFKTIGDKSKTNNFGKLPVLKYNSSARRIKSYKDANGKV